MPNININLSMINFNLKSSNLLTQKILELGITNSSDLISFIKKIPYGRNSERVNLELVLSENRGTCSSKHAFINAVATENDVTDLKLIIGMYKMTQINTPKIGNEISNNHLEYLPEAHCYLKYGDETIDITADNSNFDKIKADILEEVEIEPHQIGQFKIDYHKDFIKKWIVQEKLSLTLAEVWAIREKCIENLSL